MGQGKPGAEFRGWVRGCRGQATLAIFRGLGGLSQNGPYRSPDAVAICNSRAGGKGEVLRQQ